MWTILHACIWILLCAISTCVYTQDTGTVRLVNGPDELSGRVEIFINNTWSTVCDDEWDINDAHVVCRQLGHGTAKQADAHFGQGSGPIAFDDVDCVGDESFLESCSHAGLFNHDCVHDEDAGVVCNSNAYASVRLVEGQSRYEGRVEVYYQGQWGSICDDDWGMEEAEVVCRQLGFGPALSATTDAYFGPGTGDILLDDVGCAGDEDELGACYHVGWGVTDCGHSEDAGVICNRTSGNEGEIRLVGGSSPFEGRIEIYHDGEWGTVCDDQFDIDDATVVCTQLGFGSVSSVKTGGHFGNGNGVILLDEIACFGTETNLSSCPNAGWGNHDCSHSEDVGVVCNVTPGVATIRLVDGEHPSEGRVEIFHDGHWGTICDDSWDMVDANVACQQLGYHRAVAAKSAAYFGQVSVCMGCRCVWGVVGMGV
ncbi:scavenger receptor cysteine-rich domain-containing group B protein-like [Amphiura filiformis]|uniref:scavenger receptor cysteine-rich domain-containing group B protein-like n=1 Tax=Amphiura filiformis TaxID=82378 RepID=UPI003B226E54